MSEEIRLASDFLPESTKSPNNEVVAVYPYAGDDGLSVPTMVPHARLTIALDNHAFSTIPFTDIGSLHPVSPDSVFLSNRFSWTPWNKVGKFGLYQNGTKLHTTQEVAPVLITKLRLSNSKLRVRRISFLTSSVSDAELIVPSMLDRMSWINMSSGVSSRYVASHGLIEFDSGPGTPAQYYLHLQEQNSMKLTTPSAGLRALAVFRPNFLLVKGSMDRFFGDDKVRGSNYTPSGILHETLLKEMRANAGVLIEGEGWFARNGDHYFEFSGTAPLPNTREVQLWFPFGYGQKIRITDFEGGGQTD